MDDLWVVLVVDECHHLRREWWRSLTKLYKAIAPELVALTATPPFDVSGLEWRRYHEFCGEIDEQISIPELVAAGDLCYHQDYIYPVLPSVEVMDQSTRFAQQKEELYEIMGDLRFLAPHLLSHPWLAQPEKHYEEIFQTPEYFSALLVVLKHLGSEPPATALGVLHGKLTIAPDLNDEWLAIFLQKALRDDPYLQDGQPADLLKPVRRKLTEMGAWEKGKLHLEEPPGLSKDIRNSSAKIRAVADIVTHEWEQLGDDLRMVILTDFIYPELLPTTAYDREELRKVGVGTLFEQLRRLALPDGHHVLTKMGLPVAEERLAVLTGSLVILTKRSIHQLLLIAEQELPEVKIGSRSLFPDSTYVLIDAGTLSSKYLVRWVTRLFTEGEVNIIIGTKSLLGEGWDAPAINSLVLASTVGSFVLSNQMRGRAIRTNPSFPSKTANIWHPVTVNPALPGGGSDVKGLRRRFRAFAGPTVQGEPIIMNGLGRYKIDWATARVDEIEALAKKVLAFSLQRHSLQERWSAALEKGTHLVEAIQPPAERYYRKEDKLSRYYFEESDRQQKAEIEAFKLNWRMGVVSAFTLALLILLLFTGLPFWVIYPLACFAGGFGIRIGRSLQQLRKNRARLGLGALEAAMPDWRYYSYPLSLSLVLLLFGGAGPLLFLTLATWIISLKLPNTQSQQSVRRYELLANSRERLEAYGWALLQSLLENNKLHEAQPDQFAIEVDTNGNQMAFLADANHHDTHLFAESMNELMSPVDSPRWMLRLEQPEGWQQGEYYVPVPVELARKRESAEALQRNLKTVLQERFSLIHTRHPAGRQHLLTAKLQLAERSEDRTAKREILWR